MAKITGKEGLIFVGKAMVFDKEWELDEALKGGEIKYGENLVLIVRYEGPKGGPGMPEQLNASASIVSIPPWLGQSPKSQIKARGIKLT